jgi:hypothetical protein
LQRVATALLAVAEPFGTAAVCTSSQSVPIFFLFLPAYFEDAQQSFVAQ